MWYYSTMRICVGCFWVGLNNSLLLFNKLVKQQFSCFTLKIVFRENIFTKSKNTIRCNFSC